MVYLIYCNGNHIVPNSSPTCMFYLLDHHHVLQTGFIEFLCGTNSAPAMGFTPADSGTESFYIQSEY